MPVIHYPSHDEHGTPIDNLEKLPAKVIEVLRASGLTDDEIRSQEWQIHDAREEFAEAAVDLHQIIAKARQQIALNDDADPGSELVMFDGSTSDDDLDFTAEDLAELDRNDQQGFGNDVARRDRWHRDVWIADRPLGRNLDRNGHQ